MEQVGQAPEGGLAALPFTVIDGRMAENERSGGHVLQAK